MRKKRLAIFDIDGTIFRSSLLIELVEKMIEVGLFPKNAKKEYEREHILWLDRKADYEGYINAVVKVFTKYLKGVSYKEFLKIGEQVVNDKKDRTYIHTRDLVEDLKKKGYFLLAISQSPKGILDKFCKQLGFDKVYGRIYELGPQDGFTGKVTAEHLIANKANVVRRVLEKENVTLKGSIGVGDTEGDISFLELVDKAICFNPNEKLLRYGKLHNWDVVVERKNVIYELE